MPSCLLLLLVAVISLLLAIDLRVELTFVRAFRKRYNAATALSVCLLSDGVYASKLNNIVFCAPLSDSTMWIRTKQQLLLLLLLLLLLDGINSAREIGLEPTKRSAALKNMRNVLVSGKKCQFTDLVQVKTWKQNFKQFRFL